MASTPITGQTRLAGVIGSPVRHSASPAMHNAAFGALGLDWVYVALEVAGDSGENAVQAMRTLGLGGLNVTMPHKDAVARTADRLTPVAEALQSVNTLYWDGSQIVGHSTDGDGFVKAFAAQSQTPLSNAKVAVLGTGGAARSIVEAIGRSGAARIVVAGRDISKAETAARLATKGHACSLSDYDSVGECDIIVNATSVGMAGGSDPEGIPLPERIIEQNHTVSDIVYHPRVTPFLAAAQNRGASVVGGVGMLAYQAAESFGLWTGMMAPIDVMIAQIERPQ